MIDSTALPMLVVGAALLLFGWMLWRAIVSIAGAVIGGAAGVGLGWIVAQGAHLDGTASFVAQGIGALVGAALGVAAFRFANAFSFFLLGAALGAAMFWEAFPAIEASGRLSVDPDLVLALGLPISAVVAGAVLASLHRYAVLLASAFVGTLLVMSALDWPLGGWPAPFVFLAGLAVQFAAARRRRRDDDRDED